MKEALKLALEALKKSDGFLHNWHENYSDDESDHYSTVRQLNQNAIKTCEEALKQEQGEPVAWMIRIGDSPNWSYCETDGDADFYTKQSSMRYEKRPLYTTSQQRKPLTYEQIKKASRDAHMAFCLDKQPNYVVAFTRAIEAAHDIKEEDMDTTEKDIRSLFANTGELDRDEIALLLLQLVERIQNLENAQQRTWVGLTDEEVAEIERNSITRRQAICAIEAKLKQKNGYNT